MSIELPATPDPILEMDSINGDTYSEFWDVTYSQLLGYLNDRTPYDWELLQKYAWKYWFLKIKNMPNNKIVGVQLEQRPPDNQNRAWVYLKHHEDKPDAIRIPTTTYQQLVETIVDVLKRYKADPKIVRYARLSLFD